jgi:hypothetical protein
MVKCNFHNDLDDAIIVHTYNGEDYLQWSPYSSVPFAVGEKKDVEAFSWTGVLYVQISYGGEHSLSTKITGDAKIKASDLLSGTTSSKTPKLIDLREKSVVSECKLKNDTSTRISVVAGSSGKDGSNLYEITYPINPGEELAVRVKYGQSVIFLRRNDYDTVVQVRTGQQFLVSDLPGPVSSPETKGAQP